MKNCNVSSDEIKTCIKAFERLYREKTTAVAARISTARMRASEFYISDMEGYQRGLIEMGNTALAHFRKHLLG